MKTKIALLFAALGASLLASPGSYVPVTLALTVKVQNAETSTPLKSGNTEYAYSFRKYALGNVAILAEATRRGILPTSDYSGWQIVGAFDRDASFIGFFAFNKSLNQSAYLGPIIAPDSEDGARAESGKVQRTPANAIASGSLSFTEAGPMYLLINGEFFEGMLLSTSSEKLKPVAGGGFQWVPGVSSGSLSGFTGAGGVFSGKLTSKAGVQVADIGAAFPIPE